MPAQIPAHAGLPGTPQQSRGAAPRPVLGSALTACRSHAALGARLRFPMHRHLLPCGEQHVLLLLLHSPCCQGPSRTRAASAPTCPRLHRWQRLSKTAHVRRPPQTRRDSAGASPAACPNYKAPRRPAAWLPPCSLSPRNTQAPKASAANPARAARVLAPPPPRSHWVALCPCLGRPPPAPGAWGSWGTHGRGCGVTPSQPKGAHAGQPRARTRLWQQGTEAPRWLAARREVTEPSQAPKARWPPARLAFPTAPPFSLPW